MLDPRALWILGIANLVFSAVGMIAAATVIALPAYLIARGMGLSVDQAMKWVLYAAVLWAPIGSGAGLIVCGTLVRGIRREPRAA
jgi:hypothetical protein